MTDEDVETVTCENCSKAVPFDQTVPMVDCTFCISCYEAWLKEFHACQHEWKPAHDEHGDPGRYCRRCSGFVVDEAAL